MSSTTPRLTFPTAISRPSRVYLKSLPATSAQQAVAYDNATTAALRNRPTTQPGDAIYAGSCASCHGFDAKGFTPYMPALAGNPVVLDDNPSSLINVMLNGSIPLVAKGTPDAYRMPQFRAAIVRPGHRRRYHLHPQWLGQSGASSHCRASRQTT